MAIRIISGTGKGNYAGVDGSNRLLTRTVSVSEAQHVNLHTEKIWSIPFEDINPDGNDDYFLYIKNTGDKVIQIADVRIAASAATQIEVHAVNGTVVGGSAVTPIPKTIGSAQVPTVTIETGTDLTGLTNDGILYFIHCITANKEEHLLIQSKIRIPKGKAIALLVEVGTANLTGVITMLEEEDE